MVRVNPICSIVTVTKTATSLLESARFLFVPFVLLTATELCLLNRTKMAVPIVKIDWNKQQKSFFENKQDNYADHGVQ